MALKMHLAKVADPRCREAYDEKEKMDERNKAAAAAENVVMDSILEDCEEHEEEAKEADDTPSGSNNEFSHIWETIVQSKDSKRDTQDMPVEDDDNDDEQAVLEDISDDNEENGIIFPKPDGFGNEYLANRVGSMDPVTQKRNIGYYSLANSMTADMKSDIELLHILQGHSLKLWEEVRAWRFCSTYIYKHDMKADGGYVKAHRKTVISKIAQEYGLHNVRPRIQQVRLPATNIEAEIVVFPFGDMLLSLLTNPVAMQEENLLVDLNDPYKKPKYGGDDGYLDDLDTGEKAVTAHEKYCTGEHDILASIIGFLDKTHLDLKGKLTLEPFMFTLMLFKRQYRVKAEAWRPMGYIPNIEHLAPRAKPEDKLRDYHFCLRIVMSEMIEYQKLGGIAWTLRGGQGNIPCRLQIPLHFIIGDTEGHDKLAGRKVDHASGKSRQCRCCDIHHEDCANPYAKFTLTKCQKIKDLRTRAREGENKEVRDKAMKDLDNLLYREIKCAFDDVQFSDPNRGIHGATNAEVLHAVNLGPQERCIESCFLMKRLQNKRKSPTKTGKDKDRKHNKKRKTFGGDDEVVVDVLAEDQDLASRSKRGVFTPTMCNWIDKMAKGLHKQLRWQSETNMPRTTFNHGVSSLTKMTGSERTGVLLILLLILCIESVEYEFHAKKRLGTKEKGYLVYTLTPERKQEMVKGIWLLLLLEAFLKWTRVPIKHLDKVRQFVKATMAQVFKAFPRYVGKGLNTIKNHLASHFIDDIARDGSQENYNSGPGEKNHKWNGKEPGRRTQKWLESFLWQCAAQYCDMLAVARSWLDHMNWTNETNTTGLSVDDDSMSMDNIHQKKKKEQFFGIFMTVTAAGEMYYGEAKRGNRSKNGKRHITTLPEWKDSIMSCYDLKDIVLSKILPNIEENEVRLYSRTLRDGITFHANPSQGRRKLSKQHWAEFQFNHEDEDVLNYPCHMICFIEIPTKPREPIAMDDGTWIEEAGFYALAHRGKVPIADVTKEGLGYHEGWQYGSLAEPNQKIMHCMQKEMAGGDGERRRLAVLALDCESIANPIVGVHDPREETPTNNTYYYFLIGQASWGQQFYNEAMAFLTPSNAADEMKEAVANVSDCSDEESDEEEEEESDSSDDEDDEDDEDDQSRW